MNTLIFIIKLISSHSWLDCTDLKDNGNCEGFIRGYQGHLDLMETYQILNKENKPICDPRYQMHPEIYSQQYPRTRAKPGQPLKLSYTENGHVTKDVLDNGRPNPKQYSLHWTGKPYLGNADSQLLMRSELGSQNQLGTSYNYDDGKCAEDNTKGRNGPKPCYGTFSLPQDTKPGIYQVVWWWKFDKDPKGFGEEYTSCFDVEVLNPDGSSIFKKPNAMEVSNAHFPYQNKSQKIKVDTMMSEYKRRLSVYNRNIKGRKSNLENGFDGSTSRRINLI